MYWDLILSLILILYLVFLLRKQLKELDWWRHSFTYLLMEMSPYIQRVTYKSYGKIVIRVSGEFITPTENPFRHAFIGDFWDGVEDVEWKEIEKGRTYDVVITRK